MNSALIIGSEGQDGRLLKLFLNEKAYDEVWGLGREECRHPEGLKGYLRFDLANGDFNKLESFFREKQVSEVYYLAAFHHSSQEKESSESLRLIDISVKVNQTAFIKILDILRSHSPRTRVFYASSSLIFSGSEGPVQDESTPVRPDCVYSLTKHAAMDAAAYYRSAHGLFVSIGILYNHESVFRDDRFLSKHIVNQTRKLLAKEITVIRVGDLSAITDWGYALDYAEAMQHIVRLETPDTFIISSGKGHTVQDWFEVLFAHLGMDWRQYVVEDRSIIIRKKPTLIGNNNKLLSTGWSPKVSFEDMVVRMYNNNI